MGETRFPSFPYNLLLPAWSWGDDIAAASPLGDGRLWSLLLLGPPLSDMRRSLSSGNTSRNWSKCCSLRLRLPPATGDRWLGEVAGGDADVAGAETLGESEAVPLLLPAGRAAIAAAAAF